MERRRISVSKVEQIEKRIENLSPEDLAQFRGWFLHYDSRVWDHQITADSQAGRLDSLIAEAFADYAAGEAREL
jgi:hypothetical protein